jgi:hypothetical protein
MCDMCPDLLSCQPTHCGGYATGRPSVADIFATGVQQREQDSSAVENHPTVRASDARTTFQIA